MWRSAAIEKMMIALNFGTLSSNLWRDIFADKILHFNARILIPSPQPFVLTTTGFHRYRNVLMFANFPGTPGLHVARTLICDFVWELRLNAHFQWQCYLVSMFGQMETNFLERKVISNSKDHNCKTIAMEVQGHKLSHGCDIFRHFVINGPILIRRNLAINPFFI